MGSRGAFLKDGGFLGPLKWHTVAKFKGFKVLRPKDPRAKANLPWYSYKPDTAYILLRDDDVFDQLRVYGKDRAPLFDIDFGKHQSETLTLHIHYYIDGQRSQGDKVEQLYPGHPLYEKYKHLFKGVNL